MVHRVSSSRSLSPRPLITASSLQHRGCCLAQAAHSIGGPRVGQSALSHPPWLRGGLGAGDRPHGPLPVSIPRQCTPRARLRRPALRCPTCGRGRQDAGRGLTAGHACPRAHAQGLVNCPVLGTAPGDCGRWGGCQSMLAGGISSRQARGKPPAIAAHGGRCRASASVPRVVGLSLRSLAAPLSPLTRQPVSSSISIMCSRPGPRRSGAASRTVTPRPGVS